MPGGQYGDPYGDPYGAPPASQGYGAAAPQQPRFSAGSLVDDDGLPQWLSAPDGGAQGGWGAQAPTAPDPMAGQQWQQRPNAQPDIASQHTVRQPSIGGGGQMPPQYPFAQAPQPPAYPPQPAQPSYPSPQPSYPQPGYGPPPQPGYAPAPQPNYPQPGYAQPSYPQPSYPAPRPGYAPAPQPGYAQPSAPMNYGGNPAYQQPPSPQPLTPQSNINAFPSIDQAGTGYRGPQPQPQPQWGAGQQGAAPRAPVPSGMQARSLVDDRALPKWLRDQPESAGAANMAEWIGALPRRSRCHSSSARPMRRPRLRRRSRPMPPRPRMAMRRCMAGGTTRRTGSAHRRTAHQPCMSQRLQAAVLPHLI